MNIRRMYAIYKDEECLFYKDRNGKRVISTRNKELTDNTFEKKVYPDGDCFYRKEVTPEDIGEVYEVEPYAIHEGEEFFILGWQKDEETLSLETDSDELAEKYNAHWRGRGDGYFFHLPKDEVKVIEYVRYFDKYKYFAGEGFQYYKEERVEVLNP